MGLFSWLRGLFGGGRTAVPRKITEFRNRPARGGGSAVRYERERAEVPAGAEDFDHAPEPESIDMFELAGDRAEHERHLAEGAELDREREQEPDPEAESEKQDYRDPFDISDEARPAADESPPEPAEEEAELPAQEDYSPLDSARDVIVESAAEAKADAPEPTDETEAPVEEAEPEVVEEEAPPEVSAPEPDPVAEEETHAPEEPEKAELSAETAHASAEEVEAASEEPSADEEPMAALEEREDEHYLDTRDVKTVVGEGTITIERKRLDTKTMNIGGTKHEVVLYEYQNGTKAARVPREAINQMTEIARQNNLKVLPMQQNAAIMAGRFLGVPRSDLQEKAETEDYHLVDFTDIYYEICFDPLPSSQDES